MFSASKLLPNPDLIGNVIQGKRDGSTQDEDFAWESRNYLRKLCIGKVHIFFCTLSTIA